MEYEPINCNGAIFSNFCHAKCAGQDISKCNQGINFIENDLIQSEQ
jgi:hypothetical protein